VLARIAPLSRSTVTVGGKAIFQLKKLLLLPNSSNLQSAAALHRMATFVSRVTVL
jgi:hypothetical protein